VGDVSGPIPKLSILRFQNDSFSVGLKTSPLSPHLPDWVAKSFLSTTSRIDTGMTPAEALKAARNAGIALRLDGDVLVLNAPTPPPPMIVDALRTHKQGVVPLLQAAPGLEVLTGDSPLPPPPIDELRARLALAAADPERAGDYLRGDARIVPPAAASSAEDRSELTPLPVPEDLVNRLATVLARSTPWQRMIETETAMPYFQARAYATLAPLDPLARGLLVTAEEARATVPPKPPSRRLAKSPSETGRPGRDSITLGAVVARTAVLAVACTQCSRSGRSRISTLIEQHGAVCTIPELRRVLASDCQKRGNAHGGCDVWFPELPALFRGDEARMSQFE
jgi:hypothetical protein